MIGLAISIWWLELGVLAVCLVIYLLLYCVKIFVPIPAPVEQVIWLVVLILIIIAALGLLAGGGGGIHAPLLR
jgi:hypothetical protein